MSTTQIHGVRVNAVIKSVPVAIAFAGFALLSGCDNDSRSLNHATSSQIESSSGNRAGQIIPVSERTINFFPTSITPVDSNVQARLAEVRRRYDYMNIEPRVEGGNLVGLTFSTSLYGSGDTHMYKWFSYVASGISRPREHMTQNGLVFDE